MSAGREWSAVKLALAAQAARDAQTPDGEAGLLSSEPIAIIGMGCRLPGGVHDPEQLWTLLEQGVDAVTRVPADRWDPASNDADGPAGVDPTPFAGLLDDVVGFDASFFGIAPREAVRMDPQQRVLLEVTWDALRDAGCTVESLRGSSTGVFVAIYNDDYARNLFRDWDGIDAHTASGNSHGVSAGRISYLLDLHGPAIAVDTACSASLVALHTACRSLRAGETSMAIVGAASMLLGPEQTISLAKWGMMAPDGKCKAFDASADGWVRGEGAVTLVLKRLADALGDGDRVLAVIRGTAVNQDGRSAALTAPNGLAQRAVVRAALANARMSPSRITYVEAHGTGTSVGDPIELEALVDEIGRTPGAPCLVGTVKANIGHLEAAAGLAGVLKVVQSLRHERIPPHLHFTSINPLVSLDGTRLRVERHGAAWPATDELRVAGVSSFGFGGTNAHVIIEEAPRIPPLEPVADGPWLLTVSAHDPVALQQSAADIVDASAHALRDVAWTLAGTDALRYRVAVVADRYEGLGELLQEAVGQRKGATDATSRAAFVYSGHGSQWLGMARESLNTDPVFAASLAASDAIVQSHTGWSVLEALRSDALASRLDDTSVFQPVLVALQLALTDSWAALGIEPAAVVGHSVGELTAACVAGALTRAEVLRIAVERGRLMQAMAVDGAMLSVQGDEMETRRVVSVVDGVVLAGENGPGMLTLSGELAQIERCQAELERSGASCHRVRVTRAFHSPAITAAAQALGSSLTALVPRATTIPLYSSVTGARMSGVQLDSAYWERNARDVVRFGAATEALLAEHDGCIVEVSPHPVLLAAVHATAAARGIPCVTVPTWRRARGERATMRQSAGTLWCAGVPLDRSATFDEPGNRVSLPPYRWQHVAAWAGAPLPIGRPDATDASLFTMPGRMSEVPALNAMVFDSVVRATDAIVRDHRVCERVVVPGTMILLAVLDAAQRSQPLLAALQGIGTVVLQDVVLDRALAIAEAGARNVQIVLRAEKDGEVSFSVSSRPAGSVATGAWDRHAAGSVVLRLPEVPAISRTDLLARCITTADVHALYASLSGAGIALGEPFQLVTSVALGVDEAVATLTLHDPELDGPAQLAKGAARLDAALHAITTLIEGVHDDNATWLPVSYEHVMVPHPAAIAGSHVVLRSATSPGARVADVVLLDAAGQSVGAVHGVRVQRTDRAQLARLVGGQLQTPMPVYRMAWEPVAPTSSALAANGTWLVFEDGAATPIADAIELAGSRATRVRRPALRDAAEVDAVMKALLTQLLPQGARAPSGVVFAWGLDTAVSSSTAGVMDGVVTIAGSAMVLVRELATRGVAPAGGVLFVTRGAASVPGDIVPGSVGGGALWGLRNTAAAEHPELGLRALDLSTQVTANQAPDVVVECAATDGEVRVARRGSDRLVARLRAVAVPSPAAEPVALVPPLRPVLEALAPTPCVRRAPDAGMVEIAVQAAGLNFRDVLGALGMVSLPTGALGGECAGVVSAVGSGVRSVSVGDHVLAFALGALRTHVEVPADLIAPMPPWLSFEHASTIPIAYMTAWHALVTVARVQRGERVLVHAASGGVGLAAVHLAHWLGATVIGTAGSPAKRAYLHSIGVAAVFDSRAATFRDALRGADDQGTIDVVLNSLSDDFIPASIDALRPGGRFIEIGKRGIWSPADVAARRSDVQYTVFDLSDLAPADAERRGAMLREITALIGSGALPVLPTNAFALSEAGDAFRFMAQARHIGKLALVMPSQPSTLQTDGTYVVTGAFGALGRGVVETLVSQGARSLVLMARRMLTDAETATWLSALAARGVTAQVASVDVSDRQAVSAALDHARRTLPPLRGIVHTAGVNDDGAIVTQTAARLEGVARGKVEGANILDQCTRDDGIEFFVAFSSASGVLGWPGQATYSAANTALDQVMTLRRASGRNAVSLQWGTWAGGGMATRVADGERRFAASGMEAMSADEALALCMALRCTSADRLLVMRADWGVFADSRPRDAALYSLLPVSVRAASAVSTAPTVARIALHSQVQSLPESLRADAVRDAIMRMATRALGVPPTAVLDGARALRDLGLDSLMAVELRNTIGAALERTLPATLLFEHPTVDALAAHVLALLAAETPLVTAPPLMPASPAALRDVESPAPSASSADLAAMSDDDAEAMLLAELAARPTAPRSPRSR